MNFWVFYRNMEIVKDVKLEQQKSAPIAGPFTVLRIASLLIGISINISVLMGM